MDILSFNSEADGLAVIKTAWINYVKEMMNLKKSIINGGGILKSLSGMNDDDISGLKICGYRSEEVEINDGLTLAYATLIKAHGGVKKWYCRAIPSKYLQGASGYTETTLPESWRAPFPASLIS
jgi:hypothetical protein